MNFILKKFLDKQTSFNEKLLYLFPAIISIIELLDYTSFLLIRKSITILIPILPNISQIIFILSSVVIIYRSYLFFKKINFVALLFLYILLFWILIFMSTNILIEIFYFTIFLQIYLYLNLYLNPKFDFENLTNLFYNNYFYKIFNYFKKSFFYKEVKNKKLILSSVVILFTLIVGIFIYNSEFSSDDSDISLQKKSKQTLDRAYKCLNKDPNKSLYKAVESALWSHRQGIETKNDNYFSQSINFSNAVIDNYTVIQSIKC